ncbi:MAG: histidine--tRNA ligase [Elusimicrobia bacterium RIFOXYA2_FULL_39_19]|nr:MAG: histidine--tRNA ligase [Elusimicrobia bacterium RIFOXYA2_FULL_39_19]
MKSNYQKIRGTYDILPDELFYYNLVEKAAREITSRHSFKEIRLPAFEDAGLFIHATGETTDIVEKEMYLLKDKKDRQIALRPEGTPGVVRAFLENDLTASYPVGKFFYSGAMYRHERPQEGRRREFFQFGCEFFSNPHPVADAELITIIGEIYELLGINNINIELNSIGCPECRPKYRQDLLAFLENNKDISCDDCKIRMTKNPLRAVDCKVDREKYIQRNIPVMRTFLCNDCTNHFNQVLELLESTHIKYSLNPYIVRGLDYYTRTVFEVKHASSDALGAGGRYDNLIELLGGEKTPAVGFAIGIDRTASALKNTGVIENSIKPVFLIVQQNDTVIKHSYLLLKNLLSQNIPVQGPFPDKSFKAQMRMANSLGVKYTLILGEDELKENTVALKDMENKIQEKVPVVQLIEKLKK